MVRGHAKKLFFLEGIRKLVDRWTECIAKRGDCVEKYDTDNFCKYSYKIIIIKFLLFDELPSCVYIYIYIYIYACKFIHVK